MGSLQSPDPIRAARIRKKFHRQYPRILSGELVRSPDGRVGEYEGISTFAHPSFIAVTLYETNTNDSNDLEERVVHELPEIFVFEGQEIPVNFQIKERPEIEHQLPSRGYGGY